MAAPRRTVILSGEFVCALSDNPPRRNLGRGKRSLSPVSTAQPGDPDVIAYADDLWTVAILHRSGRLMAAFAPQNAKAAIEHTHASEGERGCPALCRPAAA